MKKNSRLIKELAKNFAMQRKILADALYTSTSRVQSAVLKETIAGMDRVLTQVMLPAIKAAAEKECEDRFAKMLKDYSQEL